MDLDELTIQADGALASLAGRVELLLDVTPVNAEEAWRASQRARHGRDLVLAYRPLETDVAGVRRALDAVPVDRVDHDVVRALLAEAAAHLDAQLRLLEARGSRSFVERSMDLWGTADDEVLDVALELLERLPPSPPPAAMVTPEQFAERARREVDHYRAQDPALQASVELRRDVPSLMVVQRSLLVGTDSWIPAHRAEALIQHEVGTHLLTAITGGRQPLTLLEHGLAGYDETQEALGVLAEHLVEGLDADRVRTLAARVVAVRRLTDGARFPDLFRELHVDHDFDEWAAWTIAMRVVRGGGLTKDVIYLRGVTQVIDHLAAGGDVSTLLIGKLHLRHVPAVEQLLDEGLVHRAHLRPRWLDAPGAADRLDATRSGGLGVATWP